MSLLRRRREDVLVPVTGESTGGQGEQSGPLPRCTGVPRRVHGGTDTGAVRAGVSLATNEKHLLSTHKINQTYTVTDLAKFLGLSIGNCRLNAIL